MTIAIPTTDSVLSQLRQLSPREQLRVVERILPELARELPSSAPNSFREGQAISELIAQQKVSPIENFDQLTIGWHAKESADEFIETIRDWRRQDLVSD